MESLNVTVRIRWKNPRTFLTVVCLCSLIVHTHTNMSFKAYCFTINNPNGAPFEWNEEKMQYLVYQKEQGESGTPHWQGYIQFKKSQRLSACKKLNATAHWEASRGTPQQAADYCKKEEGRLEPPVEFGSILNQGKRTDLKEFAEAIVVQKRKREEVINEFPEMMLKFGRNAEILFEAVAEHRDREHPPKVYWFWGASGTGKTRTVHEMFPDVWVAPYDINGFWNGYEQQEAILFDDFRSNRCKFSFLLQILDRYPMTVQIKGGYKKLNSPNIFITCNVCPQECYSFFEEKEEMEQLLRRITEIRAFYTHRPLENNDHNFIH